LWTTLLPEPSANSAAEDMGCSSARETPDQDRPSGYQAFDTEVNLLAQQKITIKTDLLSGSITQAGPSIKQN